MKNDLIWKIDARIRAANAEARRIEDEILKLTERLSCTREVRYSLEEMREETAQAIEAQRAETVKQGSVEDESAVAKPCAQGDPA